MKRREFVETSLAGTAVVLLSPGILAAHSNPEPGMSSPKISLAQWSLHRSIQKGLVKAQDFASIAHDTYQVNAVEYVNAFYEKEAGDPKFWNEMKGRAGNAGVESLLIMVDNEGELGAPDRNKRIKAVQNHLKWLEAAQILGCHSIRVNAFGSGQRPELKSALIDGLGSLAEEGSKLKINVLIENHGLHTSDASFVTEIIKEVNNDFLGTLPDFGNWCLNKEWGSTQGGNCKDSYDPYKGVEEMLPFAKGVSAKTYDFDSDGNETTIDYYKMMKMIRATGFDGYVGIEYEGSKFSEEEGIKATKKLIERSWSGS